MSKQNVPYQACAEKSHSDRSPTTAPDGERLESDIFVAQSATGCRFGKLAVLKDASAEVPPWGRFPKLETRTPKAFWFRRIQCDPTVEAVYQRLQQLEGPGFINNSRVAGVLTPELRTKMLPIGGDQLMLHQKEARNSKTLVDHPRIVFPADFDRLRRPGFNAFEDWAECGNELREWLDRLDLEWLMGDCALTLSASYALRGIDTFKVHADFILSHPATIKQQKNLARYVNAMLNRKKLKLAPSEDVIDTTIYAPHQPLYSRAPAIEWHHPDANGVPVTETLKLPFPRVHLVRMGRAQITPPEEGLHFGEKRPRLVNGMGKPVLTVIKGSGCNAILDELKPEHVHDPMARAIMSYARVTPKHLRSADRFLTLALAKAAQRGLDITENAARHIHFTLEWVSRELDIAVGVIEVEYWEPAQLPPLPPAVPFDEAREQLGSQVAEIVRAAIAYEPPAPDASDSVAAPLTPIVGAPGLGKTEAVHRALTPIVTDGHSVGVLQPNIDLSRESAKRHNALLDSTAPAGYVNRIVGRKAACINPEHGEHATQLEKLGRSPRPICDVCRKNLDCEFYNQEWNPTGANYLQHAHAGVPPKGKMKLAIFDEDPTDVLLSDDDRVRSLEDIGQLRGYAPVKRRGKRQQGAPLIGASNDVASYRARLCEILHNVKGALPIDLVRQFFDPVTVRAKRRTGNRTGDLVEYTTTIVQTARDGERKYFDQLLWEWNELTERILEAENGNGLDEGVRAQLGSILARRNRIWEQARLCKFMIKMFDVICATARIPGRKYVEAIFIFRNEDGAPSVSCYKRNPLQLTGPDAPLPNNVPTIICNGTPTPPLLLRAFVADRLPRPTLGDSVSPRVLPSPEGYYARQYPDDAYSKSHWLGELGVELDVSGKRKRKKPKALKAVVEDAERLRDMNSNANIKIGHRFILQKAYEYEGSNRQHLCRAEDGRRIDVLVIASLAVEVMLRGLGLPSNVEMLHFKKTRGTDRYGEVPCIIILGRELPPLWTLEQDVAALFFDDPDMTEIQRVKFDGRSNPLTSEHVIAMADGTGRKTKCERYPDLRVEAWRQVRSDHEVIQALHRARVLSRTADNPVEIHVFGQTDTGIPMHDLGRWVDAKRSEAEVMMAKGLVFESAETNVCAFPLLWLNSGRTARRVTSAAWELATQAGLPGWRMVSFRLEKDGDRGQRQRVMFDANRYSDPGKTVAELLEGKVIDWQWCDEPAMSLSPMQGNGSVGVRD